MIRVRQPYRPTDLIGAGACGLIPPVTAEIVVKCAHTYHNPPPKEQKESDEAVEDLRHEKTVHKLLASLNGLNWQTSFVQSLLFEPEAIFLQRVNDTLHSVVKKGNVEAALQYRWVKQIASAATWMEQHDLFHCDLQPSNILLTRSNHVKICDFDMVKSKGQNMDCYSWPWYKVVDGSDLYAGPVTEQFALGSSIYFIRSGREPLEHLNGPAIIAAYGKGTLDTTDFDTVLGSVIDACWHGEYSSLAYFEHSLDEALVGQVYSNDEKIMGIETYQRLIRDRNSFFE